MACTISWHLQKPPLQALEGPGDGIPVWCSVLYNMHYEGSSPGPSRAWGGANSHAPHWSGLALSVATRPLSAFAGKGLVVK